MHIRFTLTPRIASLLRQTSGSMKSSSTASTQKWAAWRPVLRAALEHQSALGLDISRFTLTGITRM